MRKFLFSALILLFPVLCFSQSSPQIIFNQIGYYSNGDKEAAITYPNDSRLRGLTHFRIVSVPENNTVKYEGLTGNPVQSKNSSLLARRISFSDFTTPGTYKVQAGFKQANNSFTVQFTSEPFTIGDRVLHDVGKAVLKSFYYQRASMPILSRYAGLWARPAGHPDNQVYVHPSAATAQRPANSIIATPGGWYDAADYNKYSVNSAFSMAIMLSAYEDFPDYWQNINLNIPESGNGIPDVLNEVAYNLRWLLTMQDLDGGVYHKTTSEKFQRWSEGTMPYGDNSKRWVTKKNTAATLGFAAVTAQAYRIYRNFPQAGALADSCLAASINAWNWAILNPQIYYSQREEQNSFSPSIKTGPYADGVESRGINGNLIYDWTKIDDEWYWAACELYLTTGSREFEEFTKNHKYAGASINFSLPQYSSVQSLAYYSLLRLKAEEFPLVKQHLFILADRLLAYLADNTAYRVVMGSRTQDFGWGGNTIAANQSIALINAYKISKDRKYLDAALTNIDYLLGKNATGYSFVTGFGPKSPLNPHHRISEADNQPTPIPGLVVGGPARDAVALGVPVSSFPPYINTATDYELLYLDNSNYAALNENSINLNAGVVYALNAMEYYME